MHIPSFSSLALALACLSPAAGFGSYALASESQPVRQVAIIGAGAAGSATAYFLRQFAEESGAGVNITLFEKTDRIGGRTLTIEPFGNVSQRVELGASIFIAKNFILTDASKEFNLTLKEPYGDSDSLMGIWDGDSFVFTINTSHSTWWNALKVIWKYGVAAPRQTEKVMNTIIGKFLKLYEKEYFPFRSLTQRAFELELHEATGFTGEQFLATNKIPELYAHDIIQASTRVNYASNLANIHGLDTMVSMAPEGAVSVDGGNWKIFYEMVKRSGANLELNTSVSTIGRDPSSSKFVVKTISPESDVDETNPIAFDNVVIATPYQFSKIVATDVLEHAIDEIPYVELHVTIFSSPFLVSGAYFNLTPSEPVPSMILTTLAKDDEPTSGSQGVGKAGFFSINILRKVVNPKTRRAEYLYKIFSPEKVTSEFLSHIFGIPVPDTFIRKTAAEQGDDDAADAQAVDPISWYYPHVFYSYPKAYPRVSFQDPIVGPGLYYTSGMESFISTMETNALMGKNVARLIVDDMLGKVSSGVDSEREEGLRGDETQKILGNWE